MAKTAEQDTAPATDEAAAADATATEKKERKLTDYTVLSKQGENTYAIVKYVSALNDRRAIEETVGEDGEGTFVAVPTRSFNEKSVKSVTVPKRSWS